MFMDEQGGEGRPTRLSSEGHRRGKGLPDISALYEEVDNQVQRDAGRASGRSQFENMLVLSEKSKPSTADQFGSLVGTGSEALDLNEESLVIPEALQNYLPPDLWRRLKSPPPERDVLIDALKHVRSILYLVSAFVPRHLVQEKMRRPYLGLVKGQMQRGSLLFSDVSGFTALSERLAGFGQEGAERLTKMMNRYFEAMLDILAESDGILLKFAGDAMLVYFPEQEGGGQAAQAIRAGRRMLRKMADFAQIETLGGVVNLRMKIGVATGQFLTASVGSAERMEYFVLGQAVTETMAAEGQTTSGGQLVLNAATVACLERQDGLNRLNKGFYLLDESRQEALSAIGGVDDFEIQPDARRARGAIPWSTSPQAIMAQVEVALRQVQAITPYLPPELVERLVAQSSKRQLTSQYRPTTVMFCNFNGPEALLDAWGEAGVQNVTSLLNAYFNAMQQTIQRYGGIVSRVDPYSKGTKMLILFGAPVAHEDDSQRAVSAALAMNAELEALEDTWHKKLARRLPAEWKGPLIQHRIGITSGETYAGQVGSSTRGEYTVMGDDVNLAARLMSAAEMGHILLNQAVYKDVADYFVLSARPPIRVKGKSKPIPTFQVEGPQDDTLANRARQRGPLMGRQADLDQAERILDEALQGRGALLTLQGLAGVGKSHLADIILNRAEEQGAAVFSNLCHSYHAETPFACWSNFMRSLAGITSIDYNPQSHYQKFRRLLEDLAIAPQYAPSLAALTGLRRADFEVAPASAVLDNLVADDDGGDSSMFAFVRGGKMRRKGSSLEVLERLERRAPVEAGQIWLPMPEQLSARERESLAAAVWALLESLAKRKPVMIFFEDAQWLDQESLTLLRTLSQKISTLPLLCLLAWRGEGAAGQEDLGNILKLGPMDQAGTAALISHLLVSDLAGVIHEQSLGNPLFIAEIVNWLRRTYHINADELKNVLQTSDFLQKLVLSELENLPEAQREIARSASVICSAGYGTEFRTGEVQALLATETDPVTLSNHLRALMREGLIDLIEAGADARYAFQQSLVRDILYNSLPHEQRRDLHLKVAKYLSMPLDVRRRAQARIAAALESVSRVGPVQEAEIIANHFEQAEYWVEAAQYLLTAGDQARQNQVYEKSFSLCGRALENLNRLPGSDGQEQVVTLKRRAWLGQGDAALMSGDYLSALTAYEAASTALRAGQIPAEQSSQAGPPAEALRDVSLRLALVLPTQGRAGEAITVLQRIAPSPEETNLPESAATMAWLLWRAGKIEWEPWAERTRELLGEGVGPWGAKVEACLEDMAGEWDYAMVDYLALEKPLGAALASIRMGDRLLSEGDLDRALKCYQSAQELWLTRTQEAGGVPLALYRQSEVYWRMQDVEGARQMLEQGLVEIGQEAGGSSVSPISARCRSAIRRALKLVAGGAGSATKRWPACDWQPYDDSFRISILFHP
jgi:class 3 adenylate cyclase/tetratricopeptide (TPR) repeat protein